MAVSVPIFSTSVLICTIIAGTIYFDELEQMGSPPMFVLGATITVAAIIVLAREKGRKEQEEKMCGSTSSSLLLRAEDGAEELAAPAAVDRVRPEPIPEGR
jgi:hypothetical protein